MGNPQRAARIISGVLWSRGKTHVDVLIVSHADADHGNAIPRLLADIPVHELCVTRSFLDWKQPLVPAVLDAAAKQGARIKLVQAGQELRADPSVRLAFLHPPDGERFGNDNAHSLVLDCEYRDRRILLTGDLEGAGLQRLLSLPARSVDVLQAPHHGGKKSNSFELAKWATPRWVISSQRRQPGNDGLAATYGTSATILRTCDTGAVECVIDDHGHLKVTPFRATSTHRR